MLICCWEAKLTSAHSLACFTFIDKCLRGMECRPKHFWLLYIRSWDLLFRIHDSCTIREVAERISVTFLVSHVAVDDSFCSCLTLAG